MVAQTQPESEVYSARNNGYEEIPLGLICPSPLNPRKAFDEEGLQELASSIREHGVIEPVVVRWRNLSGRQVVQSTQTGEPLYVLIAGERRWRAAQMAGLETILRSQLQETMRENYTGTTSWARAYLGKDKEGQDEHGNV